MNISNYKKKRRQHEKELNSFRNKMGKNIVWFDSLSKTKQYDLLFGWKREKSSNKLQAPEEKTIVKVVRVGWGKRKRIKEKVTNYPASLKHFIAKCRVNPQFQPHRTKVRDAAIDILLNSKK
jgi:hypothetical protein